LLANGVSRRAKPLVTRRSARFFVFPQTA